MFSWKPFLRARFIAAAFVLAASALLIPPSAQAAAGDGTTTDTNISFVGRWNRANASAFVPYWAGAYLRVGFTGTTVRLRQRNGIDLWASIDGGDFVRYSNVSGIVNLTPTPRPAGNHTLIVSYRQVAGSYRGDAVFQGLILDSGARTYALPARPKLVEFTGDSITAGATSTKMAVTAYPFVVGERLGYDHTQIAIGGLCLVETSDGCWGQEGRYFTPAGNLGSQWDFSRYTADAVVINLGTNDRGHGVSGPTFQAKYITFLRNIRAKYPNAQLIALRTFVGRYAAETQAAVATRRSEGDARVHYVDTTGWLPSSGLSDSVHPNDSGHRAIADRLAPVLTDILDDDPLPPADTFRLTSRHSGKVIAVEGGSTTAGARIVQQTANGSTSQTWRMIEVGGGYVKLVNLNSGLVIDVNGRSTADGAAVIQWTDTGGANQQWLRVSAGSNYWKLVNRHSGKVLDVSSRSTADGAPIIQWTDTGGANQQWQLSAVVN